MNRLGFFFIAWLALVSAAAAAGPIGTVESDGRFTVTATGASESAQFDRSEYTFFSGDRLATRADSTVLNLNGGGGLGVPRGTEIAVHQDDDGNFRIELIAGAVLYAFPNGQRDFEFRAGNFTVSGNSAQARAVKVSAAGEHVGTVELLEGGNIKATVRSGELFVQNGAGVRYPVAAGESVGILDLAGSPILTQNTIPASQPLVLIQSPERVGTREEFQVRWESPEVVRGDYVAIAKSGAEPDEFVTVISSDEGTVLDFTAPNRPGDYEIRFIDGETGAIRKFVYLDVVEEVIAAYWWNDKVLGPVWGVAAGALAVYIIRDAGKDKDRVPVSP